MATFRTNVFSFIVFHKKREIVLLKYNIKETGGVFLKEEND